MIHLFVGYDPREGDAYDVFCHSVERRTSERVECHRMRGGDVEGSTTFNAERFRIAEAMGYKGWAIWGECDMLCLADIAGLMEHADQRYDVLVAKHDYRTRHPVKFLGQPNPDYPRKNWSSFMLINNEGESWKRLEREPFSLADRHRFKFMDEERIGSLPLEWNWLVGEYPHNRAAKLAHFTIGVPSWSEYADCDYADLWRAERASMRSRMAA